MAPAPTVSVKVKEVRRWHDTLVSIHDEADLSAPLALETVRSVRDRIDACLVHERASRVAGHSEPGGRVIEWPTYMLTQFAADLTTVSGRVAEVDCSFDLETLAHDIREARGPIDLDPGWPADRCPVCGAVGIPEFVDMPNERGTVDQILGSYTCPNLTDHYRLQEPAR